MNNKTARQELNELLFDSGIEAFGKGDAQPTLRDGWDPYYVAGYNAARKDWEQKRGLQPEFWEELPV